MIPYLVLAAALFCAAFGQLNFKLYAQNASWLTLFISMAFFGVAQVSFFVALMDLRVGIVYMSTALTQGLVLFLSHYVLKEVVTRHHAIALALIASGLVLYAG